jgi:hypothetical protein
MFKLLKWDILNYVKKYYELYIVWAVVFVIKAVVPDDILYLSPVVNGIAAIVSMFFFIYSIVFPAVETVNWLRKDSYQLELSLPLEPWKMLLSKLIVSISIVVTGTFLTLLLWSLMFEPNMSNIVLSKVCFNFLAYVILISVLLIIAMFSYISVKSFSFTRNRPDITSVLNFFLICLLLMAFVYVFFIAIGAWYVDLVQVGDNKGGFNISANQSMNGLINAFGIIYPIAIITAGFWGSCRLFKHRFERY